MAKLFQQAASGVGIGILIIAKQLVLLANIFYIFSN